MLASPAMLLDASSSEAGSTALTLFVLAIYFIPTIVAIFGRHRRWLMIGLVNLLFGWTVIGWFVALALLATRRADPRPIPAPPLPPPAPTPSRPTRTDELERLASLHDRGVLTDDEFAAEKAKVLSQQ